MENYDSMRKIGRGNYGTVYLARDTRNGKHYCLKQIQMETYSAEERANAQQEVEVLRTLDHPGIVRYREHFLHGDSLCVVMTYCEGGDLAATIKRRAKKEDNFTEAEVLDWFVQLVMALHHVHSKKILHRDLKTRNLFLGEGGVKIGDLGVARLLGASTEFASTMVGNPLLPLLLTLTLTLTLARSAPPTTLTGAHPSPNPSQVGTPYYLSPELCENAPYNEKARRMTPHDTLHDA